MIDIIKGIIKVKELNNNGLFISEIDENKCFQDKNNPKGNFLMIIKPLEGFDKGIIYYQKLEDGFLVEGEEYLFTGKESELKKESSKWISEYEKFHFDFIEKILK